VPVYVVVAVGETEVEPLATGVTEPTPLSMEKEAAFEVVQESVAEPPFWMDGGLAESEHVGAAGGGGVVTVTVVVQCTVLPSDPVAVPVYVVVTAGETVTEPPDAGETEPTPLLMEKDAAFFTDQVSVVESPFAMDAGLAESVQEHGPGGGDVVTVIVIEQWAVAVALETVPVYVVVTAGETVTEPCATGVTGPIPLSIVNDVAFAVAHEMTVTEPPLMLVALAESEHEAAA